MEADDTQFGCRPSTDFSIPPSGKRRRRMAPQTTQDITDGSASQYLIDGQTPLSAFGPQKCPRMTFALPLLSLCMAHHFCFQNSLCYQVFSLHSHTGDASAPSESHVPPAIHTGCVTWQATHARSSCVTAGGVRVHPPRRSAPNTHAALQRPF